MSWSSKTAVSGGTGAAWVGVSRMGGGRCEWPRSTVTGGEQMAEHCDIHQALAGDRHVQGVSEQLTKWSRDLHPRPGAGIEHGHLAVRPEPRELTIQAMQVCLQLGKCDGGLATRGELDGAGEDAGRIAVENPVRAQPDDVASVDPGRCAALRGAGGSRRGRALASALRRPNSRECCQPVSCRWLSAN